MPEACPYVMMQFVRPPIVADINHRICDAYLKGLFQFPQYLFTEPSGLG